MTDYQSTQPYNIWVLRIWHESDTGDWRAVVSQSPDERRHAFTSKDALITFLGDAVDRATGLTPAIDGLTPALDGLNVQMPHIQP